MSRKLLAVLAAAGSAVALGAAASWSRGDAEPVAQAGPDGPLYGLVPAGLARIDPRSLRAIGRPLPVAGASGWSFAPDRGAVALGSDGRAELTFVDVGRMRALRSVNLGVSGRVAATWWVEAARLVAVVTGVRTNVVVVDPVAGRVLGRRRLDAAVLKVGRTDQELVLLLAPSASIRSARLAAIDRDGRVRVVDLDRVSAGVERPVWEESAGPSFVRVLEPGLAVDPERRRAYVVPPAGEVAEVDLASRRVAYHAFSERVSWRGRLRRWLEPAAYAKTTEGPYRSARWLGDGRIAVTGGDFRVVEAVGRVATSLAPAGLKLIDTSDWTVRTLDPRVDRFVAAGDVLLATAAGWDARSRTRNAIGLAAYELDGDLRFKLFEGKLVGVAAQRIYGGRAYVFAEGGHHAVDLASGRVERRPGGVPLLLVGDGS